MALQGFHGDWVTMDHVQVWAIEPKGMQCEWLGERVATVDVTRAITNVLHQKEDAGWGPNAVFRYPLEGGTGGIWKAVAAALPQEKLVGCVALFSHVNQPGCVCACILRKLDTHCP